VKRLLALLAGGLGLRAILKRRARTAPTSSPAAELKARLAATKEPDVEPKEPDVEPKEPEVEPAPVLAPEPEGVDERRADVHARARHAIDELRENGGQ
jgi:hypothetical protein